MNKGKVKMAVGGVIEIVELIFGCVWIFIFGGSALVCTFDYKELGIAIIIIMWVIVIPGIIAILDFGRKRKKRLEREKREAERNMNLNASRVFEEMATVTTAMGDMIQKSFSTENQGMQGQIITCTCPHCSGINHIEAGKTGVCEYCGSVLKG